MPNDPNLPVIDINGVKFYDASGLYKDKTGGVGYSFPYRNKSQVNGLAFHHDTAPFFGVTSNEELERLNVIYQLHTKYYRYGYPSGVGGGSGGQWDWNGIGYHGAIFPSGRIYLVGSLETMRAHVAQHNDHLTGFVFAGNFSNNPPALGSILAAGLVLSAMRAYYNNPTLEYRGHRQWVTSASYSTECPGDTYLSWIPSIGKIADASEMQKNSMVVKAIKDALAPNILKIIDGNGKMPPDLGEMHDGAHNLDAQLDWLLRSR